MQKKERKKNSSSLHNSSTSGNNVITFGTAKTLGFGQNFINMYVCIVYSKPKLLASKHDDRIGGRAQEGKKN